MRHRSVPRTWRAAFLLGLWLLPPAEWAAAETAAATRPNILWISCEDICPNLGCYGDAYACTPQLDRFATQAVRYTNAYGITGVCAPNRSCLITGVYPSSLGSHHMRCTTRLPEAIKCFPEYLRAAGYYCTNNSKTDYNFPTPATAWDECSGKAHWRNRKPGQPFFAVFNATVSHESQIRVPEARYAKNTARLTPQQRHDPARAPLPPFHPDTPEVRQDWARYYDNITAMDYEHGDRLRELEEAGLAEDTIVFFFGDNGAGMPGCKKWIWEDGLHVPLMIRFPKKYQAWAPGTAGSTCERMVSFVDFAPTVLSLAGLKALPHMQGQAFLGAHAGPARQYVYGIRDRMAERYDMVRTVRDARYQYLRNFMPHVTWAQFVSYTEEMPTMRVWRQLANEGKLNAIQARYFQPTKPVEELYDMQRDPHQVHNLAGDAQHQAALTRMRAECLQWMGQTHDLGLLPEYELNERSAANTPWEMGQDPKHNPLPRLLAAAEVANAMDRSQIPQLLKLLQADDSEIRWWGALGLVGLRNSASAAVPALQKALTDASPSVRIAAAEALAQAGQPEQALPVLIAGLEHDSAIVRLMAMGVLDRMGPAARPALPAMRKARSKTKGHVEDYLNRMVEYVPARFDGK